MRAAISLAIAIVLVAEVASADARLEYVNARPQFNVTERFFALYIGLWRGFDDEEARRIAEGAALFSRRDIAWQVRDCETGDVNHADGETIWTHDDLELDPEGRVIPISEAARPGYRYFSIANLHGLHLRGAGPFVRPSQEPGESYDAYQRRVDAAREAWWKAASPKGTKGEVLFTLTMRFAAGTFASEVEEQFVAFADYDQIASRDPAMADLFRRTAPNRWPVNHDERAHKPHAFVEPEVWSRIVPLREDVLRFKLVWDWCASEISARVLVPYGQRIAPGPNRAGRPDHGPMTISVEEADL